MISKDGRLSEPGMFAWEMLIGGTMVVPSIGELGPREIVLDAGCGFGGIAASVVLAGHHVVALDIKKERVKRASQYFRLRGLDGDFVVSDVLALPFRSCIFDFVVLSEVVEHVRSCLVCLRECHRVVKTLGSVYVSFPPYYGPFGGHLRTHIPLPYGHYLPRAVVRTLIRRKGDVGILTVNNLTQLFESLNKLTIFRFESLARITGFTLRSVRERNNRMMWRFQARWAPAGMRDLVALWYNRLLVKTRAVT
jgi:SAM-dependent methyltransferase